MALKIIAIDLAGVCRRFFELEKDGRLSDGNAFSASVQHILRAAEGFDRVVVARDIRPSFRHAFCPTYKAGREDPGPVYQKLENDVAKRMWQDGALVLPATSAEAKSIQIGEGYPEADDVIASFAAWLKPQGEDRLRILSGDSDLCALVTDHADIQRPDGSIWGPEEVVKNIGVEPRMIRELKALAGDSADKYKPFPHHLPPVEGEKTKPGIGEQKAIELLAKWGSYGDPDLGLAPAARVLLAAQDGMPDCHERRCLLAGGKTALDMGYACATLKADVALDFSRILAEPVKRSIVPPNKPSPSDAPAKSDPALAAQESMVIKAPSGADRPRRDRNQIERYALQPRSFDALQDSAKLLFDARIFPAFDSWQGIAGAIWIAAEQGLGVGQALRGTYVVKGKHAYSAALMVALVKRERSCVLFRLVQKLCSDEKAVVEFQKNDMSEPDTYTFTMAMARRMKVVKTDSKWETQPHLMLAWAAMRECARLHWPEVVAGMYTPDELRGRIEDAEFEETKEEFETEDAK